METPLHLFKSSASSVRKLCFICSETPLHLFENSVSSVRKLCFIRLETPLLLFESSASSVRKLCSIRSETPLHLFGASVFSVKTSNLAIFVKASLERSVLLTINSNFASTNKEPSTFSSQLYPEIKRYNVSTGRLHYALKENTPKAIGAHSISTGRLHYAMKGNAPKAIRPTVFQRADCITP
ncbi:hypothetical protein HMPREF1981_01767 [Bacteroides pyogenes F0041]|uniref:Uncharacterized protein n=1 Tax=Bacteroides pyogenes F0041 TaxID=1321819 RepID=U2CMX4_9BACE|nr:hypothetical protein HMPREF1981_01767 [Bacteroides pyogenes F0041]